MPIPVRRFIIHNINKTVEQQEEQSKTNRGIQSADKTTNPLKITPPDFVKLGKKPTYSTQTKKNK
jgi:hypothetical protein